MIMDVKILCKLLSKYCSHVGIVLISSSIS